MWIIKIYVRYKESHYNSFYVPTKEFKLKNCTITLETPYELLCILFPSLSPFRVRHCPELGIYYFLASLYF